MRLFLNFRTPWFFTEIQLWWIVHFSIGWLWLKKRPNSEAMDGLENLDGMQVLMLDWRLRSPFSHATMLTIPMWRIATFSAVVSYHISIDLQLQRSAFSSTLCLENLSKIQGFFFSYFFLQNSVWKLQKKSHFTKL